MSREVQARLLGDYDKGRHICSTNHYRDKVILRPKSEKRDSIRDKP